MIRIRDWVERFYAPKSGSDPGIMQALDRAFAPNPDDFADSWLQDFKKRGRLNRELANAEWILEYEKRLAALEKKAARQRSQAEKRGAKTERLRKLEHHLAGLPRSLD